MLSDTPFRKYMRERVYDATKSAIEENARRHLHMESRAYQEVLDQRLKDASEDCVVLAFCADKPKALCPEKKDNGYFTLFKKFAQDSNSGLPRGTSEKPRPIYVCRLFARHGASEDNSDRQGDGGLSPQQKIAFNHHEEWWGEGFGILPLKVNLAKLQTAESVALARANEREYFGFLVFLDRQRGNFAITHAGKNADFRFSEWRRGANVREFVSLFDDLLVRSDDFKHAVEGEDDYKEKLKPLRALRIKLRAITERPVSAFGWPSREEIIEDTRPTGWPGVYVIGSFTRQSTFYHTQERALNLAWAVLEPLSSPSLSGDTKASASGDTTSEDRANNLPDDERNIAVIGDGIAAITFAAAALLKPPHKVRMFSRRSDKEYLLRRQWKSTRYLHPTIYHWPYISLAATHPKKQLPILEWGEEDAGEAQKVVEHLKDAFNRISTSANKRFVLVKDWRCQVERGDGGRYRLWNIKTDGTRHDNPFPEQFDVVVFAVGLGVEWASREVPPYTADYWDGAGEIDIDKGRLLVAGNGDGALVDLVEVTIEKSQDPNILNRLQKLRQFKDIETIVREMETILSEMGQGAQDINLWNMYENWIGKPLNSTEYKAFDDDFASLIRKGNDLSVIFCSGKEGVFRPDTSALNRFVVYLVLRKNRAEKRVDRIDEFAYNPDKTVNVWFTGDKGNPQLFNSVALRFGTDEPKNLKAPPRQGRKGTPRVPDEWAENIDIYDACRNMRDRSGVDLQATLNPAARWFFDKDTQT